MQMSEYTSCSQDNISECLG